MRPTFLFLLISFFAVTAATAQLYDNRSRYLQIPYDSIRFEKKPYQTQNTILNNYQSNQNSYNNYRNRVNRYTLPKLDSKEFYDRFRTPEIFKRYLDNDDYLMGSPERPGIPSINFQCFCFVPIDINSILNFYSSNSGSIEADRKDYINGQEEVYSEEMSKRGFSKNYGETFKDQQIRFFKSYVQKFDSWFEHGKRTSYYEHKKRYVSEVKSTAEEFDIKFKNQIANSVVFNFLKQYKANPRNTASPIKYVGDLKIGQQFARDIPPNNYGNYNLVKSLLQRDDRGAIHQLHIRNVYNYLKKSSNNLNDYLVDRYIKQYDNEYNLYARFGYQSAYMIDHLRGHHLTPHNLNRISTEYDFSGYMTHVPYDRVAITNFYINSNTNSSYFMPFEKAKAIMAINSFPSNVKKTIEIDGSIKNSVMNYLGNALPMHYELNTIRDAINSRYNDAFKWSELPYFRTRSFQKRESPETIMSMYLEKTTSNYFYLKQYGIEGSLIFDLGSTQFAYKMHKGIGDVLKKMYKNPIYAGKEGATIRHFLKEKGLNVPSSLSDHDLGTLFDFGGGNTDYLTIEFSDYAKKYILNFHHGDGKYGWSLFTDPFKLQALEEILKENMVDFEDRIINKLTGKAECVYDKMVAGSNTINKILENFQDGNKPSQFNLKFEMSNSLGNETNASTATPKQSKIPNTFVIKINQYRAENVNTMLTVARTILHEGIHARLWEFVYRKEGGVSRDDFPGIYDYFRRFGKNWDHQQMAAHYRSTIAKGLKQFDNGQHSDAFYHALAWEGLSEIKDLNGNQDRIYTEAWKELSPSEQKSVLDIITNHKKNGSKNCN